MRDGRGTRRLLEDYRIRLRGVRAQEQFVRMIRQDMASIPPGRSPGSGGSPKGGTPRPSEGVCLHLEEEEAELKRLKTMLEWRRSVAETYINAVHDPLLRIVMRERYLNNRSWRFISARYGAGASESALRMSVVRYTDKNPITWIS